MTKPSPEDLAEQIAQLRADLARIAETLAALGPSRGETLAGTLFEQAEALKAEGLASAREKLDEATDFARKNPAQAMIMAGGAGLVLGLLFGRR